MTKYDGIEGSCDHQSDRQIKLNMNISRKGQTADKWER